MMKLRLFAAVAAAAFTVSGLRAQCTTSPSPLQEDSPGVVVYYHADQGNKGLIGISAATPIYAHTGVLTDQSKTNSDWKYAPTWGDNDPKYELEYVSENLWKLEIGDIHTYYGVPADETVTSLAFVFRSADSKREGKTADGGDIFVEVMESGLQVALTSTLDGNVVTADNNTVTFTLGATEEATLTLSCNGEVFASADNSLSLTADYTFTASGNYTITGTAVQGETVKSVEMPVIYTEPSEEREYPGGVPVMGAVRQENGDVIFCLAAPGKRSVILIGSWNGYAMDTDYTMYCQDYEGFRYFWFPVSGLPENEMQLYYYLVDSVTAVGDPYARLVLDPYNDKYVSSSVYPGLPAYPAEVKANVPLAVFQDNLNDYDWQVTDFKGVEPQHLMIYELLFRDFTGTEGRALGNGTVRQAIEKIPYLKSLGINAVELLPINEFNGNNSWGYNPNFYFAPDKAYGTPDDYKEFIDACHSEGIAVILDVVLNQSDWLHPWYQMYPAGSNPFYNADAPHAYSVLNDWNQGYPLVRQQWKDMLKYWIEEYNIDGYRFDLVKGLGDNDSYANNGDAATNAFNQSRIDNMRALQEAIAEVKPDAYFINENLAGAAEENAMAETGMLNWANINNEGCQFAMGYSSGSNLNRMLATNDSRTWGSTVSYLESHDEERLAYKQDQWGVDGVKGNVAVSMQRLGATAAQMIMTPGAHMIWQFSEMGNAQTTKSSNGSNNTDPKKVQWNLLEEPAHYGLWASYAELIGIRNSNPELFEQSADFAMLCGSARWAKGRSLISKSGDKELFTLINPLVDEPITMTVAFGVADNDHYYIMSQSRGGNATFDATTGEVVIPANCYVTIGSRSVTSGVDTVVTDGGEDWSVYGGRGILTVMGASDTVSVYDLTGSRVAAIVAGNGSVELPAGVYVAVSGNRSRKVMVR